MKKKTADLQGPALDLAVAEVSGTPIYCSGKTLTRMDTDQLGGEYWAPSTDWSQGGPIIEQERIQITPDEYHSMWWAFMTLEGNGFEYWGPTPLISAMRCFVASKLGDEVDVPEELL